MNTDNYSFKDASSANDGIYRLIEVYPHQVEMVASYTARVTVHGGQTRVVIYLMESEPKELDELMKIETKMLPDWFRYRVTRAVIDSALSELSDTLNPGRD